MKIDYTNLLQNRFISDAITLADLKNHEDQLIRAHKAILKDRKNNILGFYDLPDQNIDRILKKINPLREKYDNFVVLGIGGSALGNKAIYSALKNTKQINKKLYVVDNVDPYLIYDVISQIDITKTVFNVITKSGTTAETMATFFIFLDVLKKTLPDSWKEHLIVTTDAEKGFLRKLIKDEELMDFVVPDNVGGRFSVLSDVGLVSSAFLGFDIQSLLDGAKAMREKCENKEVLANPAYLLGLSHYLFMKKGFNISVMMPYSNALYDFADWYRQLWAESLGKAFDLNGNKINVGQTPVKALGTTDQHSQVQLYREGPNDKVFTLIGIEKFSIDYTIPSFYPDREEVNYLESKNISNLLKAELSATEYALTVSSRPNCLITLDELNEFEIGQFIFMYEVMTIFAGKLLNINPIDQPGVEEGKIATYALMGKKNFEKQRDNLLNYKEYKLVEGKWL